MRARQPGYRIRTMPVAVTYITDPGCPWAYSINPAVSVLRWRFGDQLTWRTVTIGLSEHASELDARGATPERTAASRARFRRFGMPLTDAPRTRNMATARGCRAVVAARLRHPG